MSSFIRSSEVVHDPSSAMSGITLIGMDNGRDSGRQKNQGLDASINFYYDKLYFDFPKVFISKICIQ